MEQISYYVTATAFFGVIVCWIVFAGTFLLRKKPEATSDSVKAPKSFWGIALQGVGFGLVWALHRTPIFSPFVPSEAVNIVEKLWLKLDPQVMIGCSAEGGFQAR